MAKSSSPYATVLASFWPDTGTWSDDERICALYLLTCGHRKTEGLFRVPDLYAAHDLGWTMDRLRSALQLLADRGWLMRDGDWVLLVKSLRIEQNRPKGRPRIVGACNAVEGAPRSSPLYRRFWEEAGKHCPDLHEALDRPTGDPLDTPSGPSAGTPEYSTSNSSSTSSSKPASRVSAHEAPAPQLDGQAGSVPLVIVWGRDVRPLLEQVPEWDAWLSRCGDPAVSSLLQGNPTAPWQQIAAHAVSDRKAGTLTTDDPRTALKLKHADHQKRTGTVVTDPGQADRAADYERQMRQKRETVPASAPDDDDLTGWGL
jgi:hypothetical protein